MKQLFVILSFFIIVILMAAGCDELIDTEVGEIKQVIKWYNEALVKSYGEESTKPLLGLASGAEIEKVSLLFLKLQSEKIRARYELKAIKFVNIDVKETEISQPGKASKGQMDNRSALPSAGPKVKTAKVETLEKWRYRHIPRLKKDELEPWQEAEYKVRYDLVLVEDKWIVNVVTML